MPDYDARFCCPQPDCGRAPLPPDFALLFPAMSRDMRLQQEVAWEAAQAVRGGLLKPGTFQTCINGHEWEVPQVAATAATEVEPAATTTERN